MILVEEGTLNWWLERRDTNRQPLGYTGVRTWFTTIGLVKIPKT